MTNAIRLLADGELSLSGLSRRNGEPVLWMEEGDVKPVVIDFQDVLDTSETIATATLSGAPGSIDSPEVTMTVTGPDSHRNISASILTSDSNRHTVKFKAARTRMDSTKDYC